MRPAINRPTRPLCQNRYRNRLSKGICLHPQHLSLQLFLLQQPLSPLKRWSTTWRPPQYRFRHHQQRLTTRAGSCPTCPQSRPWQRPASQPPNHSNPSRCPKKRAPSALPNPPPTPSHQRHQSLQQRRKSTLQRQCRLSRPTSRCNPPSPIARHRRTRVSKRLKKTAARAARPLHSLLKQQQTRGVHRQQVKGTRWAVQTTLLRTTPVARGRTTGKGV